VGVVDGLNGAASVTTSPDGKHVYAAGNVDNAIAVFLTDPASASATHTLTVQNQGSGTGTVWTVPAGITCGTTCTAEFPSGESVTLMVSPDPGSAFDGWTNGAFSGNGDFYFTMEADTTVTATFNPDNDGDGISDTIEGNGPNNGDGNVNGTLDTAEQNVATFRTTQGDWVTLVSETGTRLGLVTAQQNPSPDDTPAGTFGSGFFSFSIQGLTPGASTTAELILHSLKTYDRYYKYGPTPTNPQTGWYEFTYNGETGAEFSRAFSDPITLHLKDGALGDYDLQADGTIVDPGGPATVTIVTDSGAGFFISTIR